MQLTPGVMYNSDVRLRYHRGLAWSLVAALCIQLIVLTQHHHELTAHPGNCEACYVTALSSGGSSVPHSLTIYSLPLLRIFQIAVQCVHDMRASLLNFIRPFPQAPPRP